MICHRCRSDVDFATAAFWYGDAIICGECLGQWYDPDKHRVSSTDAVSSGSHVVPRHLAAVLAILLAVTPAVHASRHCLNQAEAARTWPARALIQDRDGCWTYDRHPAPIEAPALIPDEPPAAARDPTLGEWWLQSELVLAELQQLDVERAARAEPPSPQGPNLGGYHLALFVVLVLATVSVLEVAAWRPGNPSWPPWRTPRKP